MHLRFRCYICIAFLAVVWTILPVPQVESYPRFSYDLGASAGTSQAGSFVELNAAVNTDFNNWTRWRNAAFFREESEADDFYGLDSSLSFSRLIRLDRQMTVRPSAGAGYRFASRSNSNAPFGEAALTLDMGDFTLGLTGKYILHELVDDDREDEFIYGVAISGRIGGRF